MTSYSKLLALALCLTAPLTLPAVASKTNPQVSQEEEVDQTDVIWVGPGWYNGVWFNNEDDFNEWNGNRNGEWDRNHDPGDRGDRGRRDGENRERDREGGRGGGGGGRGRGGGGGGRR